MKTRAARVCLSGSMLLCILASGFSQEVEPAAKTWLTKAQSLTDDLIYDAPSLDRYDRALMWARLGEVWWQTDPQRAPQWFLKAVDLLDPPTSEDKPSLSCRLAAARTVLGIVATRDKGLHERLMSIISANREDQNDNQRKENATALADAAISIVTSDPQSAEKLGEASLRLGFSIRLANLLWKLRARDQAAADKLFMQTLQVAAATSDYNFFSLLTTAVFHGPFSSESYRRLVLSALAGVIQRPVNSPSDAAGICKLASFVPPLLTYFDALLPEQSQRVRVTLVLCRRSQVREARPSSEESTSVTVDDLLRAASDAANPADRDYYLLKAVYQAAERNDFERAISILDSIDDDGRKRLGDSWESLRWDYASSLACSYRRTDNLPAMLKAIEATPTSLRAFARISLATDCESATGNAEVIELLELARRDLEKAAVLQQPTWYVALVRLYAKLSPATAPAVLNEAVAAINRVSKDKEVECAAGESVSAILNNQLLLNGYKLPASLLESNEAGVAGAVGSIQPGDKRVAVRLELLRSVLEKERSTANKPKVRTERRQ